jgi:hypothetical protein
MIHQYDEANLVVGVVVHLGAALHGAVGDDVKPSSSMMRAPSTKAAATLPWSM